LNYGDDNLTRPRRHIGPWTHRHWFGWSEQSTHFDTSAEVSDSYVMINTMDVFQLGNSFLGIWEWVIRFPGILATREQ